MPLEEDMRPSAALPAAAPASSSSPFPPPPPYPHPPNHVSPGAWIVLDCGDHGVHVTSCKKGQQVRVHSRTWIDTLLLVGLPYGTVFTVDRGVVVPHTVKEVELEDDMVDRLGDGTTVNNAELVDDDRNQGLSHEEIERLKSNSGGKGRDQLVQSIVAASATFAGKTEFSQRKYIKKKAAKHIVRCTVYRATTRTLCEAWFRYGGHGWGWKMTV